MTPSQLLLGYDPVYLYAGRIPRESATAQLLQDWYVHHESPPEPPDQWPVAYLSLKEERRDFARNGRHIASGSGDRTVRVWDIESGQNVLTLSIEDGVTTVAISPDGKLVAAGSLDKSVRVWDAHTGYLIERLEGPDGHRDSVYSVAFSPNGRDLVSGSLDKTIKMWELHSPRSGPSVNGTTRGKCIKTFEGHKVSDSG